MHECIDFNQLTKSIVWPFPGFALLYCDDVKSFIYFVIHSVESHKIKQKRKNQFQ